MTAGSLLGDWQAAVGAVAVLLAGILIGLSIGLAFRFFKPTQVAGLAIRLMVDPSPKGSSTSTPVSAPLHDRRN